jgi:predicted MFS family arabinose efflux permease
MSTATTHSPTHPPAVELHAECDATAALESPDSAPPDEPSHDGVIRVMAVAAALSVSNLYLNQPLLAEMARTFGVSVRGVGIVPMLSQVGYAVGLFMLVPLGDILQRRRLIMVLLMSVTAALALVATSRNLTWLAAASLAVGVSTVVPQVLLPFAAQLSRPDRRGRAVGTVMMGVLLGILLSRTASGLIADRFGWRAVYWTAAGGMVLLALVLRPLLPSHEVHASLTYGALLRSVAEQVRLHATLRQAMLNGALLFAAFSAFWATLVFRLESPPLHYGATAAGMYGLIGAAGALLAPLVGRLADKVAPRAMITANSALVLVSFLIFWATGSTLWGLALGVIVLDLAVQAAQVTNMTRIYRVSATAHSRVNSAYMVTYFAGGAAGSVAGAYAWSMAGWAGVCGVGAAFAGTALVAHLLTRPSEPTAATAASLA